MSKKKGKPIALIALAIVLISTNAATFYYFTIYQPRVPLDEVPITIEEFWEDPESYLGKRMTITGYIVFAAIGPMLVTHPLVFLNNSIKSNDYILFVAETVPDLEVLGRCREVVCEEDPDCNPGNATVRLSYISDTFRDDIVFPGVLVDEILDTSILEGLDIPEISPLAQKYAVLYSGGWNETKAYYRYWNDIVYMYFILQLYGYPTDNIYVVYKDGVGEDASTPVDYPGSQTSMETVFRHLNQTLTSRDKLFFYTTNHGGTSGISTYWPNGGDQFLNETEVAGWLDSITCNQMIIIMQQCFSWKFISELSAPNRVIMTSCSPGKSAYGCDTEGPWDEFSYHFMSALVGYQLPGNIGDAFADFIVADGRISMREAYLYAAIHDSWDETPLYDDDGDGEGLWAGPVFFGSGFNGDNIFL